MHKRAHKRADKRTEKIFTSFFVILMLQMIYSYIENGKSFYGFVRFIGVFCLGHIMIHLVSAWRALLYQIEDTESIWLYV